MAARQPQMELGSRVFKYPGHGYFVAILVCYGDSDNGVAGDLEWVYGTEETSNLPKWTPRWDPVWADQIYTVKRIWATRHVGGEVQYVVEWQGYDKIRDFTIVKESGLRPQCDALITEYDTAMIEVKKELKRGYDARITAAIDKALS